MRYRIIVLSAASAALSAALLAGCAGSTGVIPVGPGVWAVSEMRAPALGGAPEAQRVALAEAQGFCGQWGLAYAPISGGPGGFPGSAYGPVSFSLSFHCQAPARRAPT